MAINHNHNVIIIGILKMINYNRYFKNDLFNRDV